MKGPRTEADARNILDLVALYTKQGFAKRINRPRATVQTWCRNAQAMLGTGYQPGPPAFDPTLASTPIPAPVQPAEKPRIRVKAVSSKYERPSRPFTVVYQTDAHNSPLLPDLSRFDWLARLINEVRPDAIVCGGDFDDLGSLCGHERNETYAGRFKPAFQQDLEASEAAHARLARSIAHDCPRYRTEGNHEARIDTFENENPETYGSYSAAYRDIGHRYGWQITPYRGWLSLQGVDFTHVPMNAMNKPASGLRPHVTLASKINRDLIFGHTHAFGSHVEHRLGPAPGRSVRVINGGCFMPDTYMPRYSAGSMKHFWYGVHVLEIENGQITGHEPITMRQLEARYS